MYFIFLVFNSKSLERSCIKPFISLSENNLSRSICWNEIESGFNTINCLCFDEADTNYEMTRTIRMRKNPLGYHAEAERFYPSCRDGKTPFPTERASSCRADGIQTQQGVREICCGLTFLSSTTAGSSSASSAPVRMASDDGDFSQAPNMVLAVWWSACVGTLRGGRGGVFSSVPARFAVDGGGVCGTLVLCLLDEAALKQLCTLLDPGTKTSVALRFFPG